MRYRVTAVLHVDPDEPEEAEDVLDEVTSWLDALGWLCPRAERNGTAVTVEAIGHDELE